MDAAGSALRGCKLNLAQLTTWVDDLDNRSRRLNLRVRGVKEGGLLENIPNVLRTIFSYVLRGQQITRLGLVRAHRTL
ncbi:Hypothetical predicted protein, partial [Pelobates cultripes]